MVAEACASAPGSPAAFSHGLLLLLPVPPHTSPFSAFPGSRCVVGGGPELSTRLPHAHSVTVLPTTSVLNKQMFIVNP